MKSETSPIGAYKQFQYAAYLIARTWEPPRRKPIKLRMYKHTHIKPMLVPFYVWPLLPTWINFNPSMDN